MRFVFIAAILTATGCGNSDDKGATKTEAPATTTPAATTPPGATKPTEPEGDYIRVLASHAKPKPTDPVTIQFDTFKVTKAVFNPANLEGATAEIEIDLASIKSSSAKRDRHLRSPSYLDVVKFPRATVSVSEVKKTGDNAYDAQAEVSAHGMNVTWPVKFEVLETKPTSVRVKASHTFSRLDLGIGKEPGDPKKGMDATAAEITLELALTLETTP